MTKRARYTFLTILILLFIIIAPIVILYTSGYRYNFTKNKIEKTGIIVLDSFPKNATIFINDKEFKTKTEARVKNLLPGTYLVRVEKEGYYAWEKLLEVKSKLTTFAEDITLFKQSIATQMISGKISNLIISKDKKTLAFLENNILKTLNLKNDEVLKIYSSASQIQKISFSANDSKILVEEKYYPHFKIIDLQDKNKIFIPKNHFGINFKKLKWDIKDGNIIYGLKISTLKSGSLYKINLDEKETSLPVAIGNSFLVNKDEIYTTEFTNNNDYLYKKSFSKSDLSTEITVLPIGNYKFLNINQDKLTLLHEDRGELVYINIEDNDEKDLLESRVVDILWQEKKGEKLLIRKDFEILVYDFKTNERELITRYGEEINQAFWRNKGNYIFFSKDDDIQVIELDSRGGSRNKITLVNFDEIRAFYLGNDDEIIYFIGKVGNQEGIYELEIAE